MLVVISDLHFVDSSAGEHDVPWQAFNNVFFGHMKALAKHNNAKEIKLLLLGDVIDLLRTRKWLQIPLEDRPWGKNGLRDISNFEPQHGSRTEEYCCWILEGIIERNSKTFRLFRKFKKTFQAYFRDEDKSQIIYVPGNHDRLVNIYPSIRDKVAKVLGLTINGQTVSGFPANNWRFHNSYKDPEYGVFARHGHEFDYRNFEGDDKDSQEAHCQVPIGDVITTEFAVRIVDLLLPVAEELPEDDKDEMKDVIFGIDNIRPWTSIPGYLFKKFAKYPGMSQRVFCALWTTFMNATKIRFARNWAFNNFFPVLCRLAYNWVSSKDLYVEAAYKDYTKHDKQIPFVLYGHTHFETRAPFDRDERVDSFYINTGTWRSRIEPTLDQEEYVSFKTMTYSIFYAADERASKAFDTWTGHQSNRGVQQALQTACPPQSDSEQANRYPDSFREAR